MMHLLVWDGRRKVGELRWEAGSALSQRRGGEGMVQTLATSPGQGEGMGPWRAASHWWKHWNWRAALTYRQGCHCQRQWWGAAFPSCSYCCISSPQRGPFLSHWKFTVTWTICKHNHFIYRNCRKYIYFQHGCLQHYSRLTVFWLELFFFPLSCFWSLFWRFVGYGFVLVFPIYLQKLVIQGLLQMNTRSYFCIPQY